MIALDVKGYCEECPYFEPIAVGKPGNDMEGPFGIDHTIKCKHKLKCEYAISHCFGVAKSET